MLLLHGKTEKHISSKDLNTGGNPGSFKYFNDWLTVIKFVSF